MKIKVQIHTTRTKQDTYGNVYSVATITNPANGKSFSVKTVGDNAVYILKRAFDCDCSAIQRTEHCTGSARLSSLPDAIYLNECDFTDEWKKALRQIGYRKFAK